MVAAQCRERIHIRITTISHTIITTICITMAVYMAMAIIDMVEIDIMAADTTIEGIMADIMAVAADTMVVDMEEEQHTEEDMRELPIEAADTIVEAEEDTVEPVVGDMPEAEAIGVAVTAEVLEAIEAAVVMPVEVMAVVEVTVAVAAAEAEAVDTLLEESPKNKTTHLTCPFAPG